MAIPKTPIKPKKKVTPRELAPAPAKMRPAKVGPGDRVDWKNINQSTMPDPFDPGPGTVDFAVQPKIDTTLKKGLPPTPGQGSGRTNWANRAEDVVPFISNVAAGLSSAPMPPKPELQTPVTLTKPSYGAERQEIVRQMRGANAGLDRSLSGQDAAAAKTMNQATQLRALGESYEKEANAGALVANQQAGINAEIEAGNVGRRNQYGQQVVERNIAQTRTRQEALANAADKFMGIQAAKRAARLDRDKLDIYERMFDAGLYDRYMRGLEKKTGKTQNEYIGTSEYIRDKEKKGYKNGGSITRMRSIR